MNKVKIRHFYLITNSYICKSFESRLSFKYYLSFLKKNFYQFIFDLISSKEVYICQILLLLFIKNLVLLVTKLLMNEKRFGYITRKQKQVFETTSNYSQWDNDTFCSKRMIMKNLEITLPKTCAFNLLLYMTHIFDTSSFIVLNYQVLIQKQTVSTKKKHYW